ncbi:MAG: DUF2520 domain-containing protein [Elusimicrobiales bacterium]|nr:DUF2520 domain-containing protein [Elusimicrobiales bacterium]
MKKFYGIAGDGRASIHLQAYFRLLKVPYKVWSRRRGLAPERVLGGCGAVFLLLKDAAIAPFLAAHPFLAGKRVMHFSGSLSVPGAVALHPLMPLAGRPLTLAEYRAIPFALEPGVSLRRLVPEFANPVLRVRREDRPLYHALCVLGGNLPVLLWSKAAGELGRRFGVKPAQAARYFRAALDNFEAAPETALTGPIARRDRATVAAGVRALGADPYARVYSLFARIHENN